jgi:hypothetical protein
MQSGCRDARWKPGGRGRRRKPRNVRLASRDSSVGKLKLALLAKTAAGTAVLGKPRDPSNARPRPSPDRDVSPSGRGRLHLRNVGAAAPKAGARVEVVVDAKPEVPGRLDLLMRGGAGAPNQRTRVAAGMSDPDSFCPQLVCATASRLHLS